MLIPLQPEDREQFILDNQWAFKYGAQQEFGMRDERCEEGDEVISTLSSSGINITTVLPFQKRSQATGVKMTRCSSSEKK